MTTADLQRVTLSTPDISCNHCVATVQETLGELEGVSRASASVETKLVDVEFDPARVSLDTIEAALDDAGYPVAK